MKQIKTHNMLSSYTFITTNAAFWDFIIKEDVPFYYTTFDYIRNYLCIRNCERLKTFNKSGALHTSLKVPLKWIFAICSLLLTK